MSGRTGQDPAERRFAAMIRELAIPAPFKLSEFGACLERRTGRAVELAPVIMAADAPSGVWLRTGRADYFYYEEQTPPFHQAHIVLSLAAQMLLGDGSGSSVDRLLVPDVSPQLVRLMLGDTDGRPVAPGEAEAFAFLALESAEAAGYPPLLARRAIRQLAPLYSALRAGVPEAVGAADCMDRAGARFRLCRQVIEIRDAVLALRPYRDPEVALAAQRDGRAAGLSGAGLAAAVEAAVLASALAAWNAGRRVPDAGSGTDWVPLCRSDLRSEVTCLAQVSRAFGRLRLDGRPARAGASEARSGEASLCVWA